MEDPRKTNPIGGDFPRLRVVKGKSPGSRIPVVADRLVIGRRKGDLVLSDPEISGTHAEIVKRDDGYFLRDLGSTNGSYVNGDVIKERQLGPGDQIGLGRTVLAWEEPRHLAAETDDLSLGDVEIESRISVGIYDHFPGLSRLGSLVEDALVGFVDEDGTQLMDLHGTGVELKLPHQSVVQLEMVGGPEKGRVVTLPSGNVIVGRYGTDIVLKDPDVSRRHMSIEVYGRDQIFMQDLRSTNGCYVNGNKLEFSKLQSGDTVVIGRSVIQLVVKDLAA